MLKNLLGSSGLAKTGQDLLCPAGLRAHSARCKKRLVSPSVELPIFTMSKPIARTKTLARA